jgi:hypothetical protein
MWSYAACIILLGLMFKESAELLYCNLHFNLTFIVPVSWGNLGVTVLQTSAGTFTTLPVILSCLPLGACMIFRNANRGATSLHSNSFKSKKSGFSGHLNPSVVAHGEI